MATEVTLCHQAHVEALFILAQAENLQRFACFQICISLFDIVYKLLLVIIIGKRFVDIGKVGLFSYCLFLSILAFI